MLKLKDVMTDSQYAILKTFNPEKIEKVKKDIEIFNNKSEKFMQSLNNLIKK